MLSNNANEAESKTLIGPETLVFSQLEYDLKLALKSSTARILQCFMLSNTHLTDQFSRISNEHLTLTSWLDSNVLTGGNTEEDVLKRGFQFVAPNRGMKFSVGSFAPNKAEGNLHKAMLCEILVGRSYAVDRSKVNDTDIPNGYKSLYIQDENLTANEYHHEYFIKNREYILPRFIIQFEYDPKIEAAAREKQKCADCERELAVVYCEADKAYLCKSCDVNLHKTKISRLHVRKPVGEGTEIFTACKTHPSRQIQYFCTQCHEPVCIDCTIMGSHSKSDDGKHALVSVEEYFKTVLEESRYANPHLNERKAIINDQIANIQSRADAVVEMGKQITAQIDTICATAKKQCNAIIEKKLTILVGDEHELRRQTGEIDRLEDFLKYQQDGDPLACVSTWHLHQMYREKLCDFQFFRQDIDAQLDAKITGKISVIVDEDKADMISPAHNASPLRKMPAFRPVTPLDRDTNTESQASSPKRFHSPSSTPNYGMLGKGTKFFKGFRSPERKTERRTSDFFHEALNFGSVSLDSGDDLDNYSVTSSRM